jgi:hypothetical protein
MELVPSVALRSVNLSGSLGVIDRIGLHGIGYQCGPQVCQPKWKFGCNISDCLHVIGSQCVPQECYPKWMFGCNISDWPSWNWFPVCPSGVLS